MVFDAGGGGKGMGCGFIRTADSNGLRFSGTRSLEAFVRAMGVVLQDE